MPPTLDAIEERLLTLPEDSRRELAQRLWDSVATPDEIAAEFTPEQLAEFELRIEQFDRGTVQTYSHEFVMREIDELLRAG